MIINDQETYDHKMEHIIANLEIVILDILSAAVKRLLDNNAAFLQDDPQQESDIDF